MEYKIERATEADGKEMLEIIEAIPAKGPFELIYTRRPNAYTSYKKESDRVNIGVIKDSEGKIILQGSVIVKDYYLNDEEYPIGYVGGFRKRPGFKEKINWMEMVANTNKYHPCDLYYCSILNENKHAKDVFTKKRTYMPGLENLCDYTTYVINPKAVLRKRWNKTKGDLVFRQINKSDLPEVYRFLNGEGKKYNFFPKISDLEKEFHGLNLEDCYIMLKNDKIVAFTAMWNQSEYKQYIVKKYNKPLNILKNLDIVTQMLGYIPFPKENEVISFPHLSFLLVKNNDIELYKYFLYNLSKTLKNKTKMFVIGIVNTCNIKNEIYDKIRSLNFQSTLYLLNYSNKELKLHKDFYIECGLL